ncbi:MAG: non-ribosomal peptide synthetase [Chthoniobacterales bacterium]
MPPQEPLLAGRNVTDSSSFDSKEIRGEVRPIRDYSLLADFVNKAKTNGQKIAVQDEDVSLSYDALHRRSNQLAHTLQALGVGPGVLVGVAIERSVDLLIALLGVVKAGGAYIPLDPNYPEARLALMLRRAQPKVVLSLKRYISRLSIPANTSLLCLDVESFDVQSENDLPETATPEDLLYVIFTSGSTGEPKGAMVQRRGFANLIEWYGREFTITGDDAFLLLSSPSFDLTQKNFFAPLAAGATIVCYPSGKFDLVLLADLIERHKITVMNCTPSTFYPLIESGTEKAFSRIQSLRLAVLGGETISIPRLRTWMESSLCNAEIANTYGPTECTDTCTSYRMNRNNLDAYSFVPLGKTISNVQLAVMDESLHTLPQGEVGELIIGGTGVGPGYLGDPERTAERFVENPLPEFFDGPKVYHTGDRVKLLPDGLLEFLGRVDHQVKFRGFRIELLEIEAALSAHPGIREAAVIMIESGGSPELVAFHVSVDVAAPVDSAKIQAFLAAKLPDYMVPKRFVALTVFPLTPNGKVDRLSLASLQSASVAKNIVLNTELESSIHKLWKEVLQHEAIELDDNFFDLGGDSIQVARVHARLMELIDRPVPITDLFANPTIRTLASHLAGTARGGAKDAIQDRAKKQRRALAGLRTPPRS